MKNGFLGAAGLAAVALTVVFIGSAGAAKPPSPGTNVGCPTSTKNLLPANNVNAFFTSNSGTATYTFVSNTNENSSGGVPGLVNYCVYTSPMPDSASASAKGADGSNWVESKLSKSVFSFSRPNGDSSNIPLDGKTTTIGTATWSSGVPSSQLLVLHINDSSVCTNVYGGTVPTCFVLPQAGPVCNAPGDVTGVGYSSLPRDVTSCSPPSEAFEATSTKEFGDEVVLNATTGKITSLTVDFQSYACSTSGHWYLGQTSPCMTTGTPTFSHDITANIYAASSGGLPGALLGTVTQTFNDIPFRPTADPTNCPGGAIPSQGIEAGSQWFNPAFGTCQYSISKLLTFDMTQANGGSGIAVPSDGDVIWTVAFNTTDYGSPAIGSPGENNCVGTAVGCPYDSLNVGTKTYPGAPYVGTDLDAHGAFISSTWSGSYCNNGTVHGLNVLQLDTSDPQPCISSDPNYPDTAWLGFTPLAQINLGP